MYISIKQSCIFAAMNNYTLIVLVTLVIFFTTGCDSDFELTSDWKEITIVYGLLDQNEEDNFIRIQKAFLDEKTNAFAIAEVADSLYHKDLQSVDLLEINSSGNNRRTIPLQRVLAGNFQLEKDLDEDDIFANRPYYLYHTDSVLNNAYTYQLKIETGAGNTVSATTPLIGDFEVLSPKRRSEVNLASKNPFVRWRKADNATLYGLRLIFYYSEFKNDEPAVNKNLKWNLINSAIVPQQESLITYDFDIEADNLNTLNNEYRNAFFAYLAENIEPEAFVSRTIDSVQYEFSFGSEDILKYSQVIAAQQQSIVSGGQGINPYSNVENGLGLLASRTTVVINRVTLDSETRDSLSCSPLVRDLNFKSATPNFDCF